MQRLSVMSYNINGLKSIIQKGTLKEIEVMSPDILCLQEIRTNTPPENLMDGYHSFFNCAVRAGYAGTAILSKSKPIKIITDSDIIGMPFNTEGRLIIAEFDEFYVVTVYGPITKKNNLFLKTEWLYSISAITNSLMKPIIMIGDFNVVPSPYDYCVGWLNDGPPGCSIYERQALQTLSANGLIDLYHHQHPDRREWRIDLAFVSVDIVNRAQFNVLKMIKDSDHFPLKVEIND